VFLKSKSVCKKLSRILMGRAVTAFFSASLVGAILLSANSSFASGDCASVYSSIGGRTYDCQCTDDPAVREICSSAGFGPGAAGDAGGDFVFSNDGEQTNSGGSNQNTQPISWGPNPGGYGVPDGSTGSGDNNDSQTGGGSETNSPITNEQQSILDNCLGSFAQDQRLMEQIKALIEKNPWAAGCFFAGMGLAQKLTQASSEYKSYVNSGGDPRAGAGVGSFGADSLLNVMVKGAKGFWQGLISRLDDARNKVSSRKQLAEASANMCQRRPASLTGVSYEERMMAQEKAKSNEDPITEMFQVLTEFAGQGGLDAVEWTTNLETVKLITQIPNFGGNDANPGDALCIRGPLTPTKDNIQKQTDRFNQYINGMQCKQWGEIGLELINLYGTGSLASAAARSAFVARITNTIKATGTLARDVYMAFGSDGATLGAFGANVRMNMPSITKAFGDFFHTVKPSGTPVRMRIQHVMDDGTKVKYDVQGAVNNHGTLQGTARTLDDVGLPAAITVDIQTGVIGAGTIGGRTITGAEVIEISTVIPKSLSYGGSGNTATLARDLTSSGVPIGSPIKINGSGLTVEVLDAGGAFNVGHRLQMPEVRMTFVSTEGEKIFGTVTLRNAGQDVLAKVAVSGDKVQSALAPGVFQSKVNVRDILKNCQNLN